MAANELDISGGGAELFLTMGPDGSVSVRYHPDFGPHDDLILLEASDDAVLNDLLHGRYSLPLLFSNCVISTLTFETRVCILVPCNFNSSIDVSVTCINQRYLIMH
jgi:hypothetical protein